MKKEIQNSLNALYKGEVILYPTDTVWGIGCDATNYDAINKIYNIKNRDPSKSMIVLIDKLNRLYSYVQNPPEMAFDMMEMNPEPLTIVFDKAKNLPENLVAEDGSIAFRLVKDSFCTQLIERFKKPIVSTSANFSNQETPLSFSDIDQKLIEQADYTVKLKQEIKRYKKPSSVIKLSNDGQIKILRK